MEEKIYPVIGQRIRHFSGMSKEKNAKKMLELKV